MAPLLKAQAESYTAALPELKEHYCAHWVELGTDPDIPLSPNYELYKQMDEMGMIVLVTLRDGAKLAGYFIGIVVPELHYSTCLTCTADIYYVLPAYRTGNGVKLFRAAEKELVRLGVNRWYVNSKIHKDAGALLRRLGFKKIEEGYSKRLVPLWPQSQKQRFPLS